MIVTTFHPKRPLGDQPQCEVSPKNIINFSKNLASFQISLTVEWVQKMGIGVGNAFFAKFISFLNV